MQASLYYWTIQRQRIIELPVYGDINSEIKNNLELKIAKYVTNSFLFPNRLVIHAKGKNATPSYLVKMGKTHKKKLLPNEQKTLGSLDEYRSPAWCRLLTRSPANSTQIDKN